MNGTRRFYLYQLKKKKKTKQKKSATGEEESIVELRERNEASEVPLAATTSTLLVRIYAREAASAKTATWALVL